MTTQSAATTSAHYDVVVLGAGAAGLMCAMTAAQRGRSVLVLEKSNKVGKKILMSGGGRCNFTNHFVEADNFISANEHFCKAALKRYTPWDFIAMVERHEIDYEERKHSQLFCLNSAKDILQMLVSECELAGVEIKTHCVPTSISHHEIEGAVTPDAYYSISVTDSSTGDSQPLNLSCQSLVVATGALSIPTLGGSSMGYDIARQFSLALTERRAGLVPFMFSDAIKPICDRLSGLSLEVEVGINGQVFTENLLFTHRGISGPVVLQISSYWHPGDEITIDLLPQTDAYSWLLESKQQQGRMHLKNLLARKLPKALAGELQNLLWPECADMGLAQLTDNQLQTIAEHLNHWHLKPSATEGYRTAEVTLGGVDTNGISSKTMEAKQQPGLYFIGEVLDVSGHLGGFNFQWAWSSGYSAGLFT